jgi:hypothetical protein
LSDAAIATNTEGKKETVSFQIFFEHGSIFISSNGGHKFQAQQ